MAKYVWFAIDTDGCVFPGDSKEEAIAESTEANGEAPKVVFKVSEEIYKGTAVAEIVIE